MNNIFPISNYSKDARLPVQLQRAMAAEAEAAREARAKVTFLAAHHIHICTILLLLRYISIEFILIIFTRLFYLYSSCFIYSYL